MESDSVIVAGLAANPTTIALTNVYFHFFISHGIMDGPEMALPHAISAPIADVEINPPDILTSKHYLVVIA